MDRLFLLTLVTVLSVHGFAVSKSAIKFAAIGDFGKDNQDEADVSQLIKQKNPDFIITVGDNNYPDGCESTIDRNIGKYYHNFIFNYKGSFGEGSPTRRFFPALGNHDWRAIYKCPQDGTLPHLVYFDLPGNERYYDFVRGPVHFFALDSDDREEDGNRKNSKQFNWLKERAEESTSPFKIAYFHHPPYSSGGHGNSKDMQWGFAKLGMDLVISGHDHSYERIERNGLVYLVNGLGGASQYDLEDPVDGSKFFYNDSHGAVFIEADEERMTVKFINHEDTVIDEKTILKKGL